MVGREIKIKVEIVPVRYFGKREKVSSKCPVELRIWNARLNEPTSNQTF
jgi:hypothetical protein